MTDSKANYKLLNKNQFTQPRGGEIDFEDIEAEVEYSNLTKELKDYIVKLSKEAISKFTDFNHHRNTCWKQYKQLYKSGKDDKD